MRLTQRQQELLAAIRRRGGVIRWFTPEQECFGYPDGWRLEAREIRALIKKGALLPEDTGLIDNSPQRYRVAES